MGQIRKRGGIWWVRYQTNGRWREEISPHETRREDAVDRDPGPKTHLRGGKPDPDQTVPENRRSTPGNGPRYRSDESRTNGPSQRSACQPRVAPCVHERLSLPARDPVVARPTRAIRLSSSTSIRASSLSTPWLVRKRRARYNEPVLQVRPVSASVVESLVVSRPMVCSAAKRAVREQSVHRGHYDVSLDAVPVECSGAFTMGCQHRAFQLGGN